MKPEHAIFILLEGRASGSAIWIAQVAMGSRDEKTVMISREIERSARLFPRGMKVEGDCNVGAKMVRMKKYNVMIERAIHIRKSI